MRIPNLDKKGESPRSGMASMVDIAFLLLIFFLVATTIMPTERDLLMQLPSPDGERAEVPALPILLELDGEGTVWWGEGAGRMPVRDGGREMTGLVELLKPAVDNVRASGSSEPPVMLKIADEVEQQRFIDLMNALAGCHVHTVAMVE